MRGPFPLFAACLLVATGARAAAPAPPTNEWPDPNFYIQDTSRPVAAMDDALVGPIPPLRVSGYTTGRREVTVATLDTRDLRVGQYVAFAAPCDPALRATILRVRSIVPITGFTVTLEYPSGVPAASVACDARLVQHGDFTHGEVGGGDITSNVGRFANGRQFPDFWISSRPAHTRLLESGTNVLIVRKVTDGPEFVYWNASAPAVLAGTRRAFGAAAYVASGPGAAARAYINDGALVLGSTTSAARRTWITVAAAASAGATTFQAGIMLEGPAGSTFVLGEFESVPYPEPLPDHAFATPVRQVIMARASISPYVGVGFTLPASGGFDVDMGQASNLTISGGVTAMIGNLEGESSTFPAALSVASPSSPTLFGPVVHQVLNGDGHAGDPLYYAFASGDWPLRDNHLLMYGAAHTTWRYVSWDLQGFLLLADP